MSSDNKKDKRKKLKILVTCGATREPIDPVRFISNYSTGVLGCEIARLAQRRGHAVVLIHAALSCARPAAVRCISTETVPQMQQALQAKFPWCDCLVMSAAVSDFRVQKVARQKIKKAGKKQIQLWLQQNPDILGQFGAKKGKKTLVGFALETEHLQRNAAQKLKQKNLDIIVATQMKSKCYPFGKVKMNALIINRGGAVRKLQRVSKANLSRILLDSIEKIVLS